MFGYSCQILDKSRWVTRSHAWVTHESSMTQTSGNDLCTTYESSRKASWKSSRFKACITLRGWSWNLNLTQKLRLFGVGLNQLKLRIGHYVGALLYFGYMCSHLDGKWMRRAKNVVQRMTCIQHEAPNSDWTCIWFLRHWIQGLWYHTHLPWSLVQLGLSSLDDLDDSCKIGHWRQI